MSERCMHRLTNGAFCKRWQIHGSRFCSHHEGSTAHFDYNDGAELHPLQRLTTVEDMFHMLRESLNATRLGRMSPAQAHAITHMAREWRIYHEMMAFQGRTDGIHRQILTDMMVDDRKREMDLAEEPHPLPVAIDNEPMVNQPPSTPPPAHASTYPGWAEQFGRRAGDRKTDLQLAQTESQAPEGVCPSNEPPRPDAGEPSEPPHAGSHVDASVSGGRSFSSDNSQPSLDDGDGLKPVPIAPYAEPRTGGKANGSGAAPPG